MNVGLFALSGLLISVSSGVMTFVMFSVGKQRLHKLWGFFCISVFIWGIGSFFIGITDKPNVADFLWRITHIGVAFIPALFMHFVYTFLRMRQRLVVVLPYILAIIFSVLAVSSDLLIANMRFVFGEFFYDSPPGLLYPLFTAYFFGLTIFNHVLLYRSYRNEKIIDDATRLDHTRIKYFFLGTLIGFTGGSMSFLPVYNIDIYPVTNFAVILYPIIMGYAILRHRLFDLRVATAQSFIFLLWIFVGVRLILSLTVQDAILNGILFAAVIILGILLVRSVSKEIDARELIQKQEQELEVVNHQQEGLLHFIRHEIKGYLTKNEAGFSAIASGDYGEVPAPVKSMSEEALVDTRKGVETVMNILDASNLKKGTVAYDKKSFDLAKAVEETVAELAPAAREKKIQLDFHRPAGSLTMLGDEEKLRRHVIRNIIDNSIKYTPSGSVKVDLTRVPSSQTAKNLLRMTVADTGVGVSKEDMAHLFTEGGRGADAIKVNVHSTGYGLFIAKAIVEAHGGKIWAESEGKDRGSRFIVELPAA